MKIWKARCENQEEKEQWKKKERHTGTKPEVCEEHAFLSHIGENERNQTQPWKSLFGL
jgi:hypothetical protein